MNIGLAVPVAHDQQWSSRIMLAKIKNSVKAFASDESGVTLLEYSLLLGIITVGAVGLILGAGGWVTAQWNDLSGDLSTGATPFGGTGGGEGGEGGSSG